MPGIGKVGRPKSKYGYYFHSIEQKLNILGPDLAFVWSGDRDLAERFGIELNNLYNTDNFSFQKLELHLNEWPNTLNDKERDEIDLMSVFRSDDQYKAWNHGGHNLDGYSIFSKLWIAGSGSDNFLKTMEIEKGKILNDSDALGNAMNILNKFYHDDLFIRNNYAEAFGGFYELATLSQNGIEKISDILITSFHIDARQLDKGIGMPITFLKYDVIDKVTIVRELKGSGTESNVDFKNVGHAYFPIIPELRESSLKTFSKVAKEQKFFDSKYIGDLKAKHTIIMLRFVDETHELKIPLYYRKSKRNTPVELSLVDGQVEMFLSQHILDTINQNIDKNIDKKNKRIIIHKQ